MKFKTQYNANEFPKQYEAGGGISRTIPDQGLTVPQIMERNRRGLSIPQAKALEYTHDENGEALTPEGNMPDLSKLDLAEIQELKAQAADQVQQLQLQLQAQELDKQKQELQVKEAQVMKDLEEKFKASQATQEQKQPV